MANEFLLRKCWAQFQFSFINELVQLYRVEFIVLILEHVSNTFSLGWSKVNIINTVEE